MAATQPRPELQTNERTAFDIWLRQDLSAQNGRIDELPNDLLAMIEASSLPD